MEKSDDGQLKQKLTQLSKSLPNMVFSVIGDSASFVTKPWPKSVLQNAIIYAAENAGDSWILCEGNEENGHDKGKNKQFVGLPEILREAVQKYDRINFYDRKGVKKEEPVQNSKMQLIVISKQDITTSETESISCNKYDISANECEKNKDFNNLVVVKLQQKNQNGNQIKPQTSTNSTQKSRVNADKSQIDEYLIDKVMALLTQMSSERIPFFNLKPGVRIRIPVLTIVVEGGVRTVVHVAKTLKSGLPVVIVKGTGKAADLILEYIENENPDDRFLKKKAAVLFGIKSVDKNYDVLKNALKTITENDWLINTFDINQHNSKEMSKIAGEAIVTAWEMEKDESEPLMVIEDEEEPLMVIEDKQEPLMANEDKQEGYNPGDTSDIQQLPDHPNIPQPSMYHPPEQSNPPKQSDPSKQSDFLNSNHAHVLAPEFSSPFSLPLNFYYFYHFLNGRRNTEIRQSEDNLKRILLEALKANRSDYVQVLLTEGIELDENHFRNLYQTTVKCDKHKLEEDEKCLHVQWILKQEDDKKTKELLEKKSFDLTMAQDICCILLGYDNKRDPDGCCNYCTCCCCCTEDNQKDGGDHENLLLWAIFANRPEIAKIIWQKTQDPLMTAVLCTVLLHKLSKRAKKVHQKELADSLKDHSLMFEKRSLQLLDSLYENDPEVTLKIVAHTTTVWGIKTDPLTFAYENKLLDIVAHSSSQRWLNRIWYNKLSPDVLPFCKSCWGDEIGKFFTAPAFKYVIHYILYTCMLVAYSSYVMTSIDDENYERGIARVWEYYTYLWTFGDLCEEIKIVLKLPKGSKTNRYLSRRILGHLNDFWNIMDILTYILLVIALLIRHFMQSESYNIARRLFSLSLLAMYLRFLQIFLIHPKLGPLLIMIKKMLLDLIDFLWITVVIVVGVGVFYHANLYPNHLSIFGPGHFETWSVWKILYYPYFQLYGENYNEFLEAKDLSDCISNITIWNMDQSQNRCPEKEWLVSVVSAAYMLFSNLLLVNLVIAMFSYTFDTVKQNSEKLWRYERYTVITDYQSRIPPPFNLVIGPFWCFFRCHKEKKKDRKRFKKEEKIKKEERHMREIQKMMSEQCS